MKKVLALVMAIVMMLAFAACTNNKPADNGNAGGADVKHKIGIIAQ